MGFRFRKSISIGGFRVNISKSGVGYSYGVKGYRITRTADGRIHETISIPGTGISHVSQTKKNPSHEVQANSSEMQKVENADVLNFQTTEYSQIVQEIERYIMLSKVSTWLIVCGILFISLYVPILFIVIGVYMKIMLSNKWKVSIEYIFKDSDALALKNRYMKWEKLNLISRIWNITSHRNTYDINDVKRNAGASNLVERKRIIVNNSCPSFLETNVNMVSMVIGKQKLHFLPDKVIIIQGNKAGVIDYKTIEISCDSIRFIENGSIPEDTKVLDYTWRYVNKNGSPDKRYVNNVQLPICHYGEITLFSKQGLNIILNCSNYEKTVDFCSRFRNKIT